MNPFDPDVIQAEAEAAFQVELLTNELAKMLWEGLEPHRREAYKALWIGAYLKGMRSSVDWCREIAKGRLH